MNSQRPIPRPPKRGYQRFRLLLAYDGTNYLGWQRLAQTPTIQQTLEDCLSNIFDESITVIGSGRTDAGVHALGQQAHFDAKPEPRRLKQLCNALTRMTPHSIVIRGVWLAPPEFHAIWSVQKKTYIYRLEVGPYPNIYNHRYSHWVHFPINFEILQEYSKFLLGKQDFTSFRTSGGDAKTTVREIYEAKWFRISDRRWDFRISGNGFLKQMVRNIVGTQIFLAKRQTPPSIIREILEAKDRQKAFWTAPAQGLTLYRVFYPRELDIQCRKI